MRLLPRFPAAFATTSLFLPLLFIADVKAAQLKEARVTQVVRDVKLLPSQDAPRPAAINDPVRDGTAVRTGGESRTELTFADQTLARLGANTIFTFAEGTRNLDLKDGAMLLRVPKDAGGARINTAAVTAAITGTTVMLEYHPRSYVKFIVLEGTGRVYLPGHVGESVLVKAGQMLITKPDAKRLPEAVDVDVSKLMTTSLLITGFRPMGSEPLIGAVEHQQQQQKASGQLYDTNVAIFGGGVTASLSDPTGTSQRDLVVATQSLGTPTPIPSATPKPSTTPRPTPTPSGTPRPTPSVTPSPTATPSATPTATPSATPTATPSPTTSPTPTPNATTVAYKSISGGNWSDPNSWTPGVVPNNNGSNLYNAVISGGSLTQNIAPGVTIQQLRMSGGTLTLANPLTLKAGLLFSGGNIYNGTLFIEGSSVQSATMDAFGLTINNSGDYDVAFDGSVFGNAPTFNNSGTLRKGSGPGASGFNGRLNNSGTLLSQSGVFSFNGGGTSSGTLSADAGAELQIASNFTLASSSQFTGAGLIRFANGTGTSLSGTLINSGRVFINSTGSYTDWVLNGGLSLSGGGSLQLSNAARIRGSGILTNVDNTI
ncbi:MAG: FecR domain-containing protein, partial [Verrucomicrobiota bacterium]